MNKVALVIGASEESIFAIESAKKSGYAVIAFDGFSGAAGLSYADVSYVVDIKNENSIISALKDIVPSIVLPVPIGRYLITTGKINDYYNLCGINFIAADNCTDKYKFHIILNRKGLRQCGCFLIEAGKPLLKSSIDLDYPFILKPRYGSGSRDIYKIYSELDYCDNFNNNFSFDEDYIIENVISGTEYGVDGVVLNNEFKLVLLREKIINNNKCIGYYSVNGDDRINFKIINNIIQKAIIELEINNCLIHSDMIISEDGTPFIIELSPRPSGENLHNIFTPLATGINMLQSYMSFVENPYIDIDAFSPQKNRKLLMKRFKTKKVGKISNIYALKNDSIVSIEKYNISGEMSYFIIDGASKYDLDRQDKIITDRMEIKYD
ncbi:MAG: ATP-grasp domain-containing protein [Eubacterium sp.]|jgi:D-alanine-D-alanine ligase-like ATP-grasp enzyme|nr:ATP-grasp domain-containing protein [Eubacterium sp.]